VAFSPDDKQLASGSFDSTVRLWDPATGAALQTLRNIGYGNSVNAVAFSPDGKQLASGSLYGTVRLWDPATGAALQTLRNNDDSDSVNAVAFSPDGKQLASGSLYGTVRLWDSATGAALLTLTLKLIDNHTYASVSAVAFSPDGKQLASGSSDGTVRLWDPATGAALLTLTMPNNTEDGYGVSANAVNAVAYSPDGKQPASTTTTSAKPTSTNIEQPPQRDGSLSKGAKVGIEVGVGVVIALGVGLLLLRRIRRRARVSLPLKGARSASRRQSCTIRTCLERTVEPSWRPVDQYLSWKGPLRRAGRLCTRQKRSSKKESQPTDDEIVTDSTTHYSE
jgi:hypothetical protein